MIIRDTGRLKFGRPMTHSIAEQAQEEPHKRILFMEITAMDGDVTKAVYQIGEPPMAQTGFPDTYLVFDLETSGLADDDLIVAIAFLYVKQNEPPLAHHLLLDWTRYGQQVSQTWLANRLASAHMRRRITVEDLQRDGMDPVAGLRYFRDLLRGLSPETDLVGHNIIGFDLPVLQRHFLEWLVDDANWLPRNWCWDTGLAEKCIGARVFPEDGELWLDYFNRVRNVHACGVHWALNYCVDKYPLIAYRLRALGRQDPLYGVLAAQGLYLWHRWIVFLLTQRTPSRKS
jgi:hypothetical protein